MRVLIVEDHINELEEVKDHLVSLFEGITVLTASNSGEARATIKTLWRENKSLDIAILDIELHGAPRRFDLDLSYLIREKFPDSLILHYTIFTDAEPVRQHAKVEFRAHNKIITKGKTGLSELTDSIRQYCEYNLVQRTKRCFAVGRAASDLTSRLSNKLSSIRCDTIEVNSLLQEISYFCDNLSKDGKKELERHFIFRKKKGKWHIQPRY